MTNSLVEKMYASMSVSLELLFRYGKEVPIWFFGNPGISKSACVKLWAESNNVEYIDMEANSRSPEDIKGYMTLPSERKAGESVSATIIKPDWLTKLENNEANNIFSVLFIDEINTVPKEVSTVLFQVIQDRVVRSKSIPKTTLIVAAGNYFPNLGGTMKALAPLLNRFCLINLEVNESFLLLSDKRYEEMFLDPSLIEPKSYKQVNEDICKELIDKSKEIFLNKSLKLDNKDLRSSYLLMGCINKYINKTLIDLIRTKKIDLNEKRISELFSENPAPSSKVYNLITPRSRDMLVELIGSLYRCYGIEAISWELLDDFIRGCVGVGAIDDRDFDNSKFVLIDNDIKGAIKAALSKFNKLNNTELNSLLSSINSLLSTPLDSSSLYNLTELIKNLVKVNINYCPFDLDSIDNIQNSIFAYSMGLHESILKIHTEFENNKTKKESVKLASDSILNECSDFCTKIQTLVNSFAQLSSKCTDSNELMKNKLLILIETVKGFYYDIITNFNSLKNFITDIK